MREYSKNNQTEASRGTIRLIVRSMGIALVLILGVGVPAGFGGLEYLRYKAETKLHAQMVAGSIASFVYLNRDMWAFQTERLTELLNPPFWVDHSFGMELIVGGSAIATLGSSDEHSIQPPTDHPEERLEWPRISSYQPVLLNSKQIAQVRITGSFRHHLIDIGYVWLSFALLAAISYRALAVAPLKLLDRTIADLHETAERAKAADIAKSEFLATMSHEIRTPLNGVLGITELLVTTQLDERQRMFTDIIRKSGRSLLGVINDILDFSKIESGFLEMDPHPFKLSAIANEPALLIARIAGNKGIEIAVRIQPDLPVGVVGDFPRISQVVTNLVGNAVKFTTTGKVAIDISGVELQDADGQRLVSLRVEVRDTGPGIAPELIEKIFQRFSQVDSSATRRHEGTGLGLSIARGLIELMGGQIDAVSTPGAGSIFWFTLQLPIDEEAAPKPLMPLDLTGKRILVIDNKVTSRCILQELLDAWQLANATAATGKDGLQRMMDATDQGRPFDLLILENDLPDMPGEEVLNAMRKMPEIADTPVILLISIDSLDPDDAGNPYGVQSYLVDPAPASRLFDAIITTLATNTAARPVEPSAADPGACIPAPVAIGTVNVLLVEDNEINRTVAEHILMQLGLSHTAAEDGVVAVARFEQTRPEIILMDVSMPNMNGYEATTRIRQIESAQGLARTPIIGLTAHAMQGDRELCLAAGMDDYLSKPVSIDKLSAMISKWRASPQPETPGEIAADRRAGQLTGIDIG